MIDIVDINIMSIYRPKTIWFPSVKLDATHTAKKKTMAKGKINLGAAARPCSKYCRFIP